MDQLRFNDSCHAGGGSQRDRRRRSVVLHLCRKIETGNHLTLAALLKPRLLNPIQFWEFILPHPCFDFAWNVACAILTYMQISRTTRAVSLTLSILIAAWPSIAQTATQNAAQSAPNPAAASPTVAVKAKEVNLLAVVRDKKGQPISNLEKQDFVLEQDGRTQTITQFSRETDLPLTLGILADTGPAQRRALSDERKSDTEFVNRLLREGKDRGFVLHFDKEVELLQDITTSHDKLAKGIDQISGGDAEQNSGRGRGRDSTGQNQPRYFFGGDMLYDAIFLSSDEVLKGVQGRKALVLFSDGVDRDSKTTLQHAIEAAQRADTLVYCVYVASEHEQPENGGFGRRSGGGGYPGGGGGYPGGGGTFSGRWWPISGWRWGR